MNRAMQLIPKRFHKLIEDDGIDIDGDGFTVWLKEGLICKANEATCIAFSWEWTKAELVSDFESVKKQEDSKCSNA